jgi:hypothetical protein
LCFWIGIRPLSSTRIGPNPIQPNEALPENPKKKKSRAPDFERIDITNILLSTSIFTAKRITQLTPEVNIETYKALAKFRT